ncbi:MAG: hypothetical protein JNL80_17270 [Phycisphaerae bacterium]|nr:hypothetical protein [Phycisphaerae bacterium]
MTPATVASLVLLAQIISQATAPSAPPADSVPTPAPSQAPVEAPATSPRDIPTVRLDPERPFPVIGWWSNGAQMIELSPDGAYRLYDSANRYRKPLEVGRWNRQNHAAFWLEPYTMRKDDRTRVPLSVVDDQVVINVRKYKAMTFIETPPMVAEDLFLGLWAGEGGTLQLLPTMRYHYVAPRAAGESQPVVISSHRGEWRLREGRVELLPDSPSVAAMLLEPESVPVDETGAATKTPATEDATRTSDITNSFNRLRSVEGTLDRIVQRATVGPGAAKPDGSAKPTEPARATPTG